MLAAEDGLTEEQGWELRGRVLDAASVVVREGRPETIEEAAFTLSLIEASPLDWRDVVVVAILLRRGSVLAGLDFVPLAQAGCRRAGSLGEKCSRWLLRVSAATPPTYREVGRGGSFEFVRAD